MFGIDRRLIAESTKKWIIIGVTAGIGSVVLSMVLYTLIGNAIDETAAGQNIFLALLPWLFLILVVKGVLGWLGRIGSYQASSETKLTVRDKVYQHALKLGPGILGRRRTGELVNMAVDGMEWLELYFGVYFVQFVIGIATPLLLCVFVFFIDWVVGLSLIISIPLTPVFLGMFAHRFRSVSARYFEMNSHLSAQFLDSLQGMTTLKLFNQGKIRGERIYKETEKNRMETMRLLLVNQIMIFITDWGFALGTTVVMTVIGLLRLRAGFLSPGELVALVLLSSEFARPLTLIGAFFFAGAIGREVAKKTKTFLEEEPEVEDHPTQAPPTTFEPGISFENVTFAYSEDANPALDNVSFEVAPGETVALIGHSGSGKTTAANLLLRLFEPQHGEIEIGEVPINAVPMKWVRSQIALVPQNPYLFYGSFADNLRIAKEDASADEMIAAAKAANIHDFITSSKDGYDSLIGEQGMSISGGQAQRLAIARALIKGSPVIILDEPTSQIDVENEVVIQDAIDQLTKNKTVLLIAHRLSTVQRANRILVLDKGKLMESGTPDELLTSGGIYARMVSVHDTVVEEA